MKVSAIQFKPILFDKAANIEFMLQHVKSSDSDLMVFPEMCTSGYYFISTNELRTLAEPFQGETVRLFQNLATNLNKIIIFGFPEISSDKLYNSAAILFPEASFSQVYRKTHLFYKENYIFTPGDTGFENIYYPAFDLNLGTMICYDWRFPEAARTLGLAGSDLIVAPSNLVTKIWDRAMPARALDNHLYLIVANRIGSETRLNETLEFNGKSVIYDYNGKELSKAGDEDTMIVSAEIEPKLSRDKSISELNNIFRDRKTEFYKL